MLKYNLCNFIVYNLLLVIQLFKGSLGKVVEVVLSWEAGGVGVRSGICDGVGLLSGIYDWKVILITCWLFLTNALW